MFVISQFILQYMKVCPSSSLPSYSIALGIIIYAALYLYLLFYSNDLMYIYNKFIIYIVSIDLLLSTFLYFRQETNASKVNEDNALQFDSDFEGHLQLNNDVGNDDTDDELDDEENSEEDADDNKSDEALMGEDEAPMGEDEELETQLERLLNQTQEPVIQQLQEPEQEQVSQQPEEDTLVSQQSEQPKRKRGRPPKVTQNI